MYQSYIPVTGITLTLTNANDGVITAKLTPSDATATGVSWSVSGKIKIDQAYDLLCVLKYTIGSINPSGIVYASADGVTASIRVRRQLGVWVQD